VGQGQGVFVSKHSKAIQKRRIHPMSTIATTNETSNVTSLPSTSKAQTAKEVIAANVKLLIEQLEAGHSEGLTAYLTAMGRFHSYSFGNILEIARQKPDATRVAGMYAWNQLGRKVVLEPCKRRVVPVRYWTTAGELHPVGASYDLGFSSCWLRALTTAV
jgi:hypothetical protein